jgi:hypothetical protein
VSPRQLQDGKFHYDLIESVHSERFNKASKVALARVVFGVSCCRGTNVI